MVPGRLSWYERWLGVGAFGKSEEKGGMGEKAQG